VVLRDDVSGAALNSLRLCRPRWPGRVAKRAFDFIVGAARLMAFTPLLLSVVVWLCGGRLVPFRQIWAIRAGGLMQITKLLTMAVHYPDAEWTVSHDQCTRVSRLLRSTHLVELPQMLNVIRGQMSLAGPRTDRPHFTLLKS
jgi:lipopolysaccharide/colanic/teichoic acid biosynthesis glycosyltransferase